eukprot:g66411.t1
MWFPDVMFEIDASDEDIAKAFGIEARLWSIPVMASERNEAHRWARNDATMLVDTREQASTFKAKNAVLEREIEKERELALNLMFAARRTLFILKDGQVHICTTQAKKWFPLLVDPLDNGEVNQEVVLQVSTKASKELVRILNYRLEPKRTRLQASIRRSC